MANYFNTEKINVFPSSFRKEETEGKYTSEHNFVNILNSIVDKDSYVLSLSQAGQLRVVIHGYYFEIDNFMSAVSHPCFLKIRVENGQYSALVNYANSAITNLDEGGEFKGLYFEDNGNKQSSDGYTYYVLQVTDQDGNLVNKVRLSTDSIFYDDINDLTSKLDGKQENLSAGYGINASKLASNEVSLTDNYNKLLNSAAGSTIGSNIKPVYVANGEIKSFDSLSDAGSKYVDKTTYKLTKGTYMEDGSILTGTTFFMSTDMPLPNVDAKNGDFWFKYQ